MPDVLLHTLDPILRAFTASLPALSSLTPLDYLCLITLGVFALDGLRRGLIFGVLDVIVLGLTLSAAVSLYPLLGTLITERLDLPGALVNVIAFVAVFAIGQAIYAVAAALLRAVVAPFFLAVPSLGFVNSLGGFFPGFVKGAIVIGLLASAVRSLPMAGDLKALFDGTIVIQRTAPIGAAVVPDLPALLGRLDLDQIVVTPPPQSTGAPQRTVQFPPNLRTEVDLSSEQRMLDLVNQERANNGLAPLVMAERLREVARGHSEEMFRLSYFAHESPVAGSPFDRMQRGGVRFSLAGENLAYAPNVEVAHRGLMNSPEHRKNILTPGFRRVGIGVVQAGSWGRMFTQDLAD